MLARGAKVPELNFEWHLIVSVTELLSLALNGFPYRIFVVEEVLCLID